MARETRLHELIDLTKQSDEQALLLAKLAIENADEKFSQVLKDQTKLFC